MTERKEPDKMSDDLFTIKETKPPLIVTLRSELEMLEANAVEAKITYGKDSDEYYVAMLRVGDAEAALGAEEARIAKEAK
jgi:hypothetical protein